MAAQIDSSKPLHVKLIHLANGDPLIGGRSTARYAYPQAYSRSGM